MDIIALLDTTVLQELHHKLNTLVLQVLIVIELIFIIFYIVYHVLEVLLVLLVVHPLLSSNVKLVNSATLVQNQVLLTLIVLRVHIHLTYKQCRCKIVYLALLVNIVMELIVLQPVQQATIARLVHRFQHNTHAQEEHIVPQLD